MSPSNEVIRESSMENLWNIWFSELHKNRAGFTLKIKNIVFSGQSDFQRIDVFDTYEFGRMLVLYGSIMLTEKDEFIYHEMISHVPLCVHPNPEEVLVIGGGDGGALREMLKHPKVKHVKVVEIDKMVVEICKKYFPNISKEFLNPKVETIFDDGAKYINDIKIKFDLIIVDSSDPIGPAEVLFQKGFYEQIYDKLKEDGILIAQTESPIFHQKTIRQVYKNMKDIFPCVELYLASIPTYPSGLWSFAFCSKKYHPLKDFNKNYFVNLNIRTKYYNEEIHEAAFKLPNFIKELIIG